MERMTGENDDGSGGVCNTHAEKNFRKNRHNSSAAAQAPQDLQKAEASRGERR